MLKIKITFILVVLACIIPVMVQGQGCMETSSDEGVSVKGFIQPQFEYNEAGGDYENSFTFNRARFGLIGSIPYDISYYFFVETSAFKAGDPYLLDAFVTYSRLSPYAKLSIGQFKSPISLEQNTSCSGLHTINRSQVVNQMAGPQRDIGLMLSSGFGDTSLVSYSFALMNGAGLGAFDNNRGKDIVGRVVFHPLNFLKVGGSFRYAKEKNDDPNVEDDKTIRYGGELQIEYSNFLLQGEYIGGEDVGLSPVYGGCGGIIAYKQGTEKSGYFVQAMYMTSWNLQPVIKYESYDEDLNTDGDNKTITTFGLNYFLNDWTRIQINYIYCAEETYANEVPNDMFIFQIQAKF